MRAENVKRLSSTEISLYDPSYLHYYFFHQDLSYCFDKYAKGDVFDIGCGNKPYKSMLGDNISSYTGCDIVQSSEQCVDILCDATDIPVGTDSFDTVICTQTIEHVGNHQQLVNEAFRILKPGGCFIVSGPMYWPLHEEPYDFFRFTKHGFRKVLEEAGFKVEEIKSNGGKWSVCGQVIIHTIYPRIKTGKTLKSRFLKSFVNMMGGIKGINKFFLKMDLKYKDEKNTMNYVVVGRK